MGSRRQESGRRHGGATSREASSDSPALHRAVVVPAMIAADDRRDAAVAATSVPVPQSAPRMRMSSAFRTDTSEVSIADSGYNAELY